MGMQWHACIVMASQRSARTALKHSLRLRMSVLLKVHTVTQVTRSSRLQHVAIERQSTVIVLLYSSTRMLAQAAQLP